MTKTKPGGPRTLSPGEMFGLQAMLHGGVYHSTATAETDCVVYRNPFP